MKGQIDMVVVIPPSPADVHQTKVFQRLLQTSSPLDGLAERTERFVAAATPLVDFVMAGPFREYTLHNRDHAKKLLHLMEYIAPDAISQLSPLECAVLVFSAFLHDMGMVVTWEERQGLIQDADFLDTFRGWPEVWGSLQDARKRLSRATDEADKLQIETEIYQLQEAALTAHLRPRHASTERYSALLGLLLRASGRPDLTEVNGVSFQDVLIEVCCSHNLDAGVLAESKGPYEDRFGRDLVIGGYNLNAQFCAALLRIADILDFDRERTPAVLFESLGIPYRSIPGANVSLLEWRKQMAIHTIRILPDELEVIADSTHPAIESAIRTFCGVIEREIRDTTAVLRRNQSEILAKYAIQIPITVRARIRSIGYTFKDLSFRLNESSIMNLLMGEKLYSNPGMAIRELIQNSLDACNARRMITRSNTYVPRVTVTSNTDHSGRVWIEVADNGTGMDEFVLSNFFFKVGSSYYDSSDFRRLVERSGGLTFTPISRFGIGVLSVFMIADAIDLFTRNLQSPRGDLKGRHLTVEGRGALAFVTETDEGEQGTSFRLRLRRRGERDVLDQIRAYLLGNVIRPHVPIQVQLGESPFILGSRPPITFKPEAVKELAERGIEAFMVDLGRWSAKVSGQAILFLFSEGNRLTCFRDGSYLRLGSLFGQVDPMQVFEHYVGNRITVSGFRMNAPSLHKTLVGSAYSLFAKKPKFALAYDFDVVGDASIEYDVSRSKIASSGSLELQHEFRDALMRGLDELGVIKRLDEATSNLIVWGNPEGEAGTYPPFDRLPMGRQEEILRAVQAALPTDKWPRNVHKDIAKQLSISNSQAYRAITALLERGIVVKPMGTQSDLEMLREKH